MDRTNPSHVGRTVFRRHTAFPVAHTPDHSTRLRLKAGNQLLDTALPFTLLMNRLLGRINALATLYDSGVVITPDEKQHLLNLAETVHIEHSTLAWHDWQRHSQRSHSTMPSGGQLGETIYRGGACAVYTVAEFGAIGRGWKEDEFWVGFI